MNTPPLQDEGPGIDPGGPFWSALLHVLRDVTLGQVGDWIDGPPGWWWMSVQTGTFIATWWMLLLGSPVQSMRAYIALDHFGVLYISFLGGTFAIWSGTKILRLKYGGTTTTLTTNQPMTMLSTNQPPVAAPAIEGKVGL